MAAANMNGARDSRVLPHSLDQEAAILGGIFLRNDVLERVPELEVDDFYDHRHRVVFQAMRNLANAARSIDVVTVESEVEKAGKLEAIGGFAFLGELQLRVPTADNVVDYACTVRAAHAKRELAIATSSVSARSYRGDDDADELLADATRQLDQIRERFRDVWTRGGSGGMRLSDAISNIRRNELRPIFRTGFPQLDELAPLMGGHVVVVIGGPGSGKTTWTLQVAQHHAESLGPAQHVTLEQTVEELAARIVSRVADVPWFDALRGGVSDSVMRAILNHDRIRAIDSFATVPAIRRAAVALQAEYPGQLVLVVVDYTQLVSAEGREERERMKNAIEGLRALAKELGVVLMLVSQTSRSGAKGLRSGDVIGRDASEAGAESSQIERAAYVTLTLGESEDVAGTSMSKVMLSIGKARMGRAERVIPLDFDGRRGLWSEAGTAVSVSEHRASKSEVKAEKRSVGAADAIVAALTRANAPLTANQLVSELGLKRDDVYGGIKKLLRETPQRAVRVKGKKVGGVYPLWTPGRATQTGIDIVERSDP